MEMRQSAYDGFLKVWGKTPISSSKPRRDRVFQKIPTSHWETFEVQYLDSLRKSDYVLTTKGTKQTADSWISLMVSKAQVESLWPPKALEPLKIVVGSGSPFDEYRIDEYGRHHTVNVIIMNRGKSRIDGIRFYRTYLSKEPVLNSKVCLCGPISLAAGERHPVSLALYNESDEVPFENRRITLSSPSAGMFNTTILLPPSDYLLLLEGTSIDGPTSTTNCRLWVNSGNVLRVEDLNNLSKDLVS
jgi:hypothetical protein